MISSDIISSGGIDNILKDLYIDENIGVQGVQTR